ncbi:hypothetical protein DFH09DRAFT_1378035 [Mycena vulgaris]|nr:hypothetical protein DFH09DRAFT_1378035 [Mycena vulgaris]
MPAGGYQRYYPQTAPVAVAARWIIDKSWRGCTTAAFFVALYTLLDPKRRSYVPRWPDGTAPSTHPAGSAGTAESKFMNRTGPKVSTFFSCALLFSRADIIVLQRPLRGSFVTLFVTLCIVFLGLFLVLLVVAFVKQRSGTGRPRSWTDDALPKVATQTSTPPVEEGDDEKAEYL